MIAIHFRSIWSWFVSVLCSENWRLTKRKSRSSLFYATSISSFSAVEYPLCLLPPFWTPKGVSYSQEMRNIALKIQNGSRARRHYAFRVFIKASVWLGKDRFSSSKENGCRLAATWAMYGWMGWMHGTKNSRLLQDYLSIIIFQRILNFKHAEWSEKKWAGILNIRWVEKRMLINCLEHG